MVIVDRYLLGFSGDMSNSFSGHRHGDMIDD